MSRPIRASAVVCTLDRGPEIALTIESLVRQDLPAGDYEILIVDNGSNPENAEILRAQAGGHERPVRPPNRCRINKQESP